LIQTQFPDWADLPIKLLQAGGTENVLYRLGEHLVIRLPRIPEAVAPLEKDATWLLFVAPHLPLQIPQLLARGMPSESYPFIWGVYAWLEGTDLFNAPLENQTTLALDLVNFIQALQRIPIPEAPPPARGKSFVHDNAEVRQNLALLPSEFQPALLEQIWQQALAAPAWAGMPVWSHGDLHGANLLGQHGRLSAVLDFGALGVGDPIYDYASAWMLLSQPTRALFRDTLGLDDATWVRSAGVALRFAAFAYPYYLHTNPVLTGIARYSIEQILLDEL
jgi:aminoglycoside phosphotransferase (APT) family kinase protein